MTFADITGAQDAVRALAGMVDSGRVPHAIMFEENDGGGAMMVVQAFLQYLYCRERRSSDSCGECPQCRKVSKLIHPDIHYVFPVNAGVSQDYAAVWRELVTSNPCFTERDLMEALDLQGKSSIIAVAESKALLQVLSLSALQGGYRSVVVYLPEKLNREAANRLLKIVEEPPLKTQFLFVTHAPEEVLPTISSRCQRIRLMPVKPLGFSAVRQDDPFAQERRIFADLMGCLLSRDLFGALDVAEIIATLPSREKMRGFCTFAGGQLRRMFLLRQKGLETLAVSEADDAEVAKWAGAAKPTFPRLALEAFSRADSLISRNVSARLVFTDLITRLSALA